MEWVLRTARRIAACTIALLLAACARMPADAVPGGDVVDPSAAAPVAVAGPVVPPRFEMTPDRTLRETLERWAASSGWTVRWASDRAYPIKGRAVFEGEFVQAAGELIRSFRQLNPPPIARFYTRNRELRVVTPGDEMGE